MRTLIFFVSCRIRANFFIYLCRTTAKTCRTLPISGLFHCVNAVKSWLWFIFTLKLFWFHIECWLINRGFNVYTGKSGSVEATGENNIDKALCPLEGEFTFKYYLNGRALCETGSGPMVLEDESGLTNGSATVQQSPVQKRSAYDYEQPLSVIRLATWFCRVYSACINSLLPWNSTCPARDILHATFRTCEITDRGKRIDSFPFPCLTELGIDFVGIGSGFLETYD